MNFDRMAVDSNVLQASGDGIVETLTGATVMMVDDDAITLEVIQAFLGEAGYHNIITQSQPDAALKMIRERRPDVVLLDLLMPGLSGFDILRIMRDDDELRYIPVIMLTAASDADTKLRALELGATDFLAKPVDPSELSLRLRNTLAFKAYRDRLAYFDNLTELPNRRAFLNRLNDALRRRRDDSEMVAVLHADLDRFKQINDTLGHSVGDSLLKSVAYRFSNALQDCERICGAGIYERLVLARFGGDEFTLLAEGLADEATADYLARRLRDILAEPFHIGRHEFFVTASIGIAVSPRDGNDAAGLIKHSEIALNAAKSQGGNVIGYYSGEMNARALDRLTLETSLRRAVERSELVLHYQPQVDLRTGAMFGVEALMRWQHPEFGLLPPNRFIPLAEEVGLIHELGEWAIAESCRQAVAWDQAGAPGLMVSVNVATPQFHREGFLDSIRHALAESGLPPERLLLEITESMLMSQTEQVIARLNEIKALGVRLSLDDFGTGYSSFSYLKSLPLDEIKIDRAFIADMDVSPKAGAIVDAIIALGKGLGLTVLAEGIETEAQLTVLKAGGCSLYQGFFYSKPRPADEIPGLMQVVTPA